MVLSTHIGLQIYTIIPNKHVNDAAIPHLNLRSGYISIRNDTLVCRIINITVWRCGIIILANKIWRIFSVILTIAIIGLAILLVGVRFIGLTPYVVLSGSMEPTYSTGSLIYVKKIAPAKVQVGDAITFNLNGKNTVATHRAVEIDLINEHFITKGDANESVDGSSVKFSNLIGKPVFCIPLLGYISYFLTSLPTLYIVVAIVVVLLIILFFPSQKSNGQKAIIKRRF